MISIRVSISNHINTKFSAISLYSYETAGVVDFLVVFLYNDNPENRINIQYKIK